MSQKITGRGLFFVFFNGHSGGFSNVNRLCALMIKGQGSLNDFVAKARISIRDAVNFYNACVSIGLVRHSDATTLIAEPGDSLQGDKSVMKRVMQRLFG